jgi:uncharacterized protein (TIGR02598 family)
MKSVPPRAFSLIEVVLALGVTTFCIVALMGLFALGMKTEKESAEELQAAHIAQGILAARRGAPGADLGGNFPLPALQAGSSVPKTTVKLRRDGSPAADTAESRYALTYRIDAPTSGSRGNFVVHLNLHWPAQAAAAEAQGHLEFLTILPSP